MPVWRGVDAQGVEHTKVIGSYQELKELSGVELEDYHRPWIDDVTFTIDNVEYHRIDKVLDCWFESGSMPFAQFHYPFENKEKFEQNFPGDFIAEYVGQVRAWFYYLQAVNVGLFDKNPFKNVIVTGTLAGNDGRKMSKSYGNYTDPNELMDQYSADALRFLLLSSPVLNAEDYSLQDRDVAEVARKLGMIWNMYDFFTLYADVDGWEWNGELVDPLNNLKNPLDRWIVSRLHQVVTEVETNMDRYDLPDALKPILPFIDDASNWYVRRSRKRFWKSGDSADKADAYKTLHYVLVMLSQVLAPFVPFLSEELYRQMTGGESVHLLDWPKAGSVDAEVIDDMAQIRAIITAGLAERAAAGIKVRQPLANITVQAPQAKRLASLKDILVEELNVKEAVFEETTPVNVANNDVDNSTTQNHGFSLTLDTEITDELKREGLMREIIRHIQNTRKDAGLQVDDRIVLQLGSDHAELKAVWQDSICAETIKQETLAVSLNETELDDSCAAVVKIDTATLGIKLHKT